MRKVTIICTFMLIALSITPLFTIWGANEKATTHFENNKTTNKPKPPDNLLYKENALNIAMDMANEDFCDESLKAILAIAINNAKYYELNSENLVLDEYEKNSELYNRLKKLYSTVDYSITYRGECVFIPTSSLSKGYTKTDIKYPYLISVASPWDCMDEDFIFEKEYSAGVSLKGIDYLCKNGMSDKEALSWYLPMLDIK